MKLRNKKTGEIGEAHWVTFRADGTDLCVSLHENGTYEEVHSLAELNEEWEDYKPKEPLIKDEKIRKTVKEWFDANNFGCRVLQYYKDGYNRSHFVHAKGNTMKIFFREEIDSLQNGGFYTIAELCGEEEE